MSLLGTFQRSRKDISTDMRLRSMRIMLCKIISSLGMTKKLWVKFSFLVVLVTADTLIDRGFG